MSEKRRALGRGLGALIPSTPPGDNGSRPVDVFFKDNSAERARASVFGPVVREGDAGDVSRETEQRLEVHHVRRRATPRFHGKRPAWTGVLLSMRLALRRSVQLRPRPRQAPWLWTSPAPWPMAEGFTGNTTDRPGDAASDGVSAPVLDGRGADVQVADLAPGEVGLQGVGAHGDADWSSDGETVTGTSLGVMSDRSDANSAPDTRAAEDAAPGPDGVDAASAVPDVNGLTPVPGAWFAELPVLSIRPNPRQPRTVFDDDDMAELAHSIAEIGVLQPVVVRPIPVDELADVVAQPGQERAQYELIMGERRWRATQEAGLATIPAIVKETHDDDLLRDALLENLHRSQLNALEEAAAYQQLLDDFGCTHDELATRIGRSRPQISNTLRLLKLPPLVQRRVAAGVLSAPATPALCSAWPTVPPWSAWPSGSWPRGCRCATVEEIVTIGSNDAPRPARRPRAGARHPQLDDLAARLSDRFDTRVSIALGQRKGKLTVEFASVDDLNRIVELLGSAAEQADGD